MSRYSDQLLADGAVFIVPMAEASGHLVDSVGALTSTGEGGLTYRVATPFNESRFGITYSGTSSFTDWNDDNALDLGNTFSIEFWIKRTSTGVLKAILDKGNTGGTGYCVYFTASNFVRLAAGLAGTTINDTNITIADTTLWHHVVHTKSGSTVTAYTDGVESHTAGTPSTTLTDTTNGFTIGSFRDGTANFAGTLTWVAFYKTALTASQVLNHYGLSTTPQDAYHPVIVTGRLLGPQSLRRTFRHPIIYSGADAAAGPQNLNLTATDSVTYGDAATRTVTLLRAATDSTTYGDVATRTVTLLRSVTDAVTRADVATTARAFVRSATDSTTYADVATRTVTLLRSATDSVTRADAATRTVTLLRSVTDSTTWADVATQVKTLTRSATDSVTYADAATRTVTLLRAATDSVTRSDAVTRTVTLVRAVTDSVTYADVATQVKSIARQATDSVTYSDAATRTVTLLRSVTDSVTRSDAATRLATLLRTVTDSVTYADVATQTKTISRSVADSVTRSDAATRTVTLLRAVTDSTTYADVATKSLALLRTATDSITRSDVAVRVGTFLRSVGETVTWSDIATAIGGTGAGVAIGGLPPVAAAMRFIARVSGRAPRPDAGATGPTPQSDANHPKPE